MDEQPPAGKDDKWVAQEAADLLALALENVGFDVGRAFPMLTSGAGLDKTGFVELGRVASVVASDLAFILSEAAGRGVSL